MLPSADEILTTPSKARPLQIDPWVAAGLSRLWQTMKVQIQSSIVAGTLGQPQTVQSGTASAGNRN